MTEQQLLLAEIATAPEFVEGNLYALAGLVTSRACSAFSVDRTYLWQVEDRRSLRAKCVAYSESGEDAPAEISWAPPAEHVRRMLREGKLAWSNSSGEALPTVGFAPGPTSAALHLPIQLGGRVVAVLCLETKTEYREWDSETILHATALANLLGQAFYQRETKFQESDALRVAEVYQRAIAAAGAAPYLETYEPNVYTFMGEQIANLTGYTPDEFTPQLLSDIVHEYVVRGQGTGMPLDEAVERARRGEFDFWQCDMAITTKSGEIRWISEISVENIGPDGRSHDSIGLILDITDRVLVEREAQRIEDIYRRAISAAGAVPYVHTYKPVEKYTFVDAGIAKLTGYSAEEVTPEKLREITVVDSFLGESSSEKIEQIVAKARRGEIPIWHLDSAIRTKSGDIRWISDTSIELLGPDGTSEGSIGLLQDITERKQAEEDRLTMQQQLLHTQKLESLGILAGGIAHDFNNLLVAIVGNLELSLEILPADAGLVDYLRPALDAACRASDLSRQMLAYSGKGQFVVTSLDLSDIVEKNALILRSAVPRNVELKLALMRPVPPIIADAGQIQQVVMNLITNAAEAIGETEGTVTLSTGTTHCGIEYLGRSRTNNPVEPGEFVFVEVIDTGCGMSDETQARLFDPFYTTKFTGRGLGMSAVLGVVRGHNGAIILDSQPGFGTRIRVLFPVVPSTVEQLSHAPSPPEQPAESDKEVRSGTILVVDDEDMVRTLCKRMLTRLGHEVLLAKDGVEGVDLFRERAHLIDCVILDMTMPRLNGHGAFLQMRAIRPDAKIIIASGYSEQQISEEFAGQTVTGFMQKPFLLQRLKQELARVL